MTKFAHLKTKKYTLGHTHIIYSIIKLVQEYHRTGKKFEKDITTSARQQLIDMSKFENKRRGLGYENFSKIFEIYVDIDVRMSVQSTGTKTVMKIFCVSESVREGNSEYTLIMTMKSKKRYRFLKQRNIEYFNVNDR